MAFDKVLVAITALLVAAAVGLTSVVAQSAPTWCVARSDASSSALQTALDYACSRIADCAPIQPSGLCYLPNTIQAHASYAFNSYYQRATNAPGSCSFGGVATVATTDPSYGSCAYPSSPSTAGGVPGVNPSSSTPPPPLGTTVPIPSNGGLTPSLGPIGTNTNNGSKALELSITNIVVTLSCLLFVLSFMWKHI